MNGKAHLNDGEQRRIGSGGSKTWIDDELRKVLRTWRTEGNRFGNRKEVWVYRSSAPHAISHVCHLSKCRVPSSLRISPQEIPSGVVEPSKRLALQVSRHSRRDLYAFISGGKFCQSRRASQPRKLRSSKSTPVAWYFNFFWREYGIGDIEDEDEGR